MKGIFCFDGPLHKDINGVYCDVTLTNEMFNRYLYVVDELIVIVRVKNENKKYAELNLKPLNLERIQVIEIDNILSPVGMFTKKRKFENEVESLVEDVDAIFARMPSVISNSVLKIAKKKGKKCLAEVGGCAWDAYWNHGIMGKIVAPYMYFQAKKSIKNVDFATYVTKEFLQKRYPTKGEYINCSNVYLMEFDDDVLFQRINKIKSENKKIIVGTAVNSIDVRYKGEHYVIGILPELRRLGYDVEYEIVGMGTGDYLRKKIKENKAENIVRLIGVKNKNEIMEWYKSIDIYIQPSKQEGLPRVVIEAMSTGCPALGSNIAGIPELLESKCLFNPDKSQEIVKAFVYLLEGDNMKKNSIRNYEMSKDYAKDVLENRRKEFFEKYINSINLK